MEICQNCKQRIHSTDHIFKDGDVYVHSVCPDSKISRTEEAKESSQKTNDSSDSKPHSVIERAKPKTASKELVITKVDISWTNAFWLGFQFIVVLTILSIPILVFYFIILFFILLF